MGVALPWLDSDIYVREEHVSLSVTTASGKPPGSGSDPAAGPAVVAAATAAWYLVIGVAADFPDPHWLILRLDPVVELIPLSVARDKPIAELAVRSYQSVSDGSSPLLDLVVSQVVPGRYAVAMLLVSADLAQIRPLSIARFEFR